MAHKTIVTDSKYCGKYVALDTFSDRNVIADGDEPLSVIEKARQSGAEQPIIVFVPDSGIASI